MALGRGGYGGGGHGGGGHGGGGHWGGRGGWGGSFYTPDFIYYDDWSSNVSPMPVASFYRNYVITRGSNGYAVSKGGDTAVLKVFSTYGEARSFIDTLVGVKGLDGMSDSASLGSIVLLAGIVYLLLRKRVI